jgi:hypothetical protein
LVSRRATTAPAQAGHQEGARGRWQLANVGRDAERRVEARVEALSSSAK